MLNKQEVINHYLQFGWEKAVIKYGISHTTLTRWRKSLNIPPRSKSERKRKYDLDETFFDVIDTEDKAYWLGFIAGDGTIERTRVSVDLNNKDDDHIIKLQKSLKTTKPIYKGRSTRLQVHSRKLVTALTNFGVGPNKSLSLNVNMNFIPKELHKHFYRGIIDADGSLFIRGKRYQEVRIQFE